eukprot:INCI9106.1.p1 GENE.INCI9106.1~~INCI9106.1.p1  ORF type:complete len:276 (+),score=24.42 INCI9106.1:154-981(+)
MWPQPLAMGVAVAAVGLATVQMVVANVLSGAISQPAWNVGCPNSCSGHGVCVSATGKCNCYDGWGSATDIVAQDLGVAVDCSQRVCGAGRSWNVLPADSATVPESECHGRGICNRLTGVCQCRPGFVGASCEHTSCPDDCSGHGVCISMSVAATKDAMLPLSSTPGPFLYGTVEATWDGEAMHGCLCDSAWAVGLGANETQDPEYFGPNCALRHCPSGDDPVTAVDETDCENVASGAAGNLCHVDCSNRGDCNHATGTCNCRPGFRGEACDTLSN